MIYGIFTQFGYIFRSFIPVKIQFSRYKGGKIRGYYPYLAPFVWKFQFLGSIFSEQFLSGFPLPPLFIPVKIKISPGFSEGYQGDFTPLGGVFNFFGSPSGEGGPEKIILLGYFSSHSHTETLCVV